MTRKKKLIVRISKKKKMYNFGLKWYDQQGCLYIKKKHSNLVLTLTDLKGQVIFYRTAGMVVHGNKRKDKILPQVVSSILAILVQYIRYYRINSLELILRIRLGSHFQNLKESLMRCGIGIRCITSYRYLSLILVYVEDE